MAEHINTHRCSGLLKGLLSKAGYMVDDRREIGGTIELDLGQTHPVSLHHTFNAYTHRPRCTLMSLNCRGGLIISVNWGAMVCKRTGTKRISWVEIERKLVGNLQKIQSSQAVKSSEPVIFMTSYTWCSSFFFFFTNKNLKGVAYKDIQPLWVITLLNHLLLQLELKSSEVVIWINVEKFKGY